MNEEKSTVRAFKETLDKREQELVRKEQELSRKEAEASKPKFKPEDYESHALKLENEAYKLEQEGEVAEAERPQDQTGGHKPVLGQPLDEATDLVRRLIEREAGERTYGGYHPDRDGWKLDCVQRWHSHAVI